MTMKKIGTILAVLLACACSRYDYDHFNGTPDYRQEIGEQYTRNIVEYLLIDNLRAMEKALGYDALSSSVAGKVGSSDSYRTGGLSIWSSEARWTVNAVEPVEGVQIRRAHADSTWSLTRDADYRLGGNPYPTRYAMTVRMLGRNPSGYADWAVSLKGERTERKGYSCKFDTPDAMTFVAGGSDDWVRCEGRLFVEVFRNGTKVDKCCIQYSGGRPDYQFINGL